MEQVKKPVFRDEEIPLLINHIKLNTEDREKLRYGERTGLLENMIFDDEVRDGKVFLSRDDNGNIEVNYNFKKPHIIIPNQLDEYNLTTKDKTRLLNNETVGPFEYRGTHMFLQIDQDLNSIIVKSGHELSIPDQLAGYQLSGTDKELLANGKMMPSHLFCIEGRYYTAEIGMSEDKRGLIFHNYKSQSHLPKAEIETLAKKINRHDENIRTLESTGIIGNTLETVHTAEKKEIYQLPGHDGKYRLEQGVSGNNKKNEIFHNAINDLNMNMLFELKRSGYQPSQEDIGFINKNRNLNPDERKFVFELFDIQQVEVHYDKNNVPQYKIESEQKYEKATEEKDASKMVKSDKKENPSTGEKKVVENKVEQKEPEAFAKLEQGIKKEEKGMEKSAGKPMQQQTGNLIERAFSDM